MHCETLPVEATAAARFHRTVARMRRVNMLLCDTWVDRLCEQLEAEWHESEAARLESAVTDHESERAVLLARGAPVDERFTLMVMGDGSLAYAHPSWVWL